MDLDAYAQALVARFENPHLHHQTYQIAMDGTEKLPQRILAPACAALEQGQPLDAFAFAVAAWMRYVLGRDAAGQPYDLRDPRQDALHAARRDGAEALCDALHALPGLFPGALLAAPEWRRAVSDRLQLMLELGMAHAIHAETALS
ncbi:hypothetical protein [Tropicibacter naphthalenivorans]|uniref:mannitol dehydrogenase family protein n=1 Tax=Tropicibacter naphthalenivorans TaxID=441103 RepID=UPI0022869D45|nr:hypothetical protein [Tropicibacter naphthalenivorans]